MFEESDEKYLENSVIVSQDSSVITHIIENVHPFLN